MSREHAGGDAKLLIKFAWPYLYLSAPNFAILHRPLPAFYFLWVYSKMNLLNLLCLGPRLDRYTDRHRKSVTLAHVRRAEGEGNIPSDSKIDDHTQNLANQRQHTPGNIFMVQACRPWHSGVLAGEVQVVEEHVLGLRSRQMCISLAWSSCCPLVQL